MEKNKTKRPAVPQLSVCFILSEIGIYSRKTSVSLQDIPVIPEPQALWQTCASYMYSGVHFNSEFLNS
jgi:hypothetical protein